MKLRINNNSIRLRLTQSEVGLIAQGEPIIQKLNLFNDEKQDFGYSLNPSIHSEEIKAKYQLNNLIITVPSGVARTWATTDQVTLRHVQDKGAVAETVILIEKDFQCLHKRPGEDESDNFPNPTAE